MKTLLRLLALVAMLVGSTQLAHANGLTGSIGFTGGAVLGGSGITFNPVTDKISITGTGSFASFTAGTPATFATNFSFAGISAPGGEQLFSALNSTSNMQLVFVVTSYTVTGTGQYIFYGTLTLYNYNNVTHTQGSVIGTIATSFSYKQNIPRNDFTGSLNITPEPSSLLLLGTGLVGAAGMAFRRKRNTASV